MNKQKNYKSREEIPEKYKWNFNDIYKSWKDWESDFSLIKNQIKGFQKFKGKLNKDVQNLIKLLKLEDNLSKIARKVAAYIQLQYYVDTKNHELLSKLQQVQILFTKFETEGSWIEPEMLTIPEVKMNKWIKENHELKDYEFRLKDMYRMQKHVLSENKEKLLSYYSQTTNVPSDIYTALSTADMEHMEIKLSDGKKYKITPGVLSQILTNNPNQKDRLKASKASSKVYYKNKNTYAAIYNGIGQSKWSKARSRNYSSVLDAALESKNIPRDVYLNLINTVKQNTGSLHRYEKLRKKVLGLKKYYGSDGQISLVDFNKLYSYEEAKELVYNAMKPLGKDYQDKLKIAMSSGWLDVYENPGKRPGAFSMGVYGVHPYMMLNYSGTLRSVFTLAHELGHTMHTWFSDENQPYATHDYTIFVAEVASTFNECLLLDYMMENTDNPIERVALLNQSIQNIVGIFFIQTMFADFEYQFFTMIEQGKPVNADVLGNIWKNLNNIYSSDIIEETKYSNYGWTRISHFYGVPYYVYQYATCFASSAQIYNNTTKGNETEKKESLNKYLTLLKSGGNDFPMEQLKKAGVDLTKSEPINAVINQLDEMVKLLAIEIDKITN